MEGPALMSLTASLDTQEFCVSGANEQNFVHLILQRDFLLLAGWMFNKLPIHRKALPLAESLN
jgi:hypothetical protein